MAQTEQPKGLLANKNRGRRFTFEDRNLSTDQIVHGEVAVKDEEGARKKPQRKGIRPLRVSKVRSARKKRITQEDIATFTYQLVTMMKAGLLSIQAFEIVARSHSNPSITQMPMRVRADVEQGSALDESLSRYPKYFNRSYCNSVSAGETSGVLEGLLDKLAVYKGKTQAIKKKVKTALTYPIAIVVVAVALIFVMMMLVSPALGEIYSSMGAELPGLAQIVMSMPRLPIKYDWMTIVVIILVGFGLYKLYQKSPVFQKQVNSIMLHLLIFGPIVRKVTIACWSRMTVTLLAAGVPLVKVLDSVTGTTGGILYEEAARGIQAKVAQGLSLTSSIQSTEMLPNMITQTVAIGEESGSLDDILNKAAEFYEEEVDSSVLQLSLLMEPIIMVISGSTTRILLVAMYLSLFNLGNVIG